MYLGASGRKYMYSIQCEEHTYCPSEEEPPIPDDRFDALAFRLLKGVGVREVSVVRMTPEAKDSPKNLKMRLSELVTVKSQTQRCVKLYIYTISRFS